MPLIRQSNCSTYCSSGGDLRITTELGAVRIESQLSPDALSLMQRVGKSASRRKRLFPNDYGAGDRDPAGTPFVAVLNPSERLERAPLELIETQSRPGTILKADAFLDQIFPTGFKPIGISSAGHRRGSHRPDRVPTVQLQSVGLSCPNALLRSAICKTWCANGARRTLLQYRCGTRVGAASLAL